MTLTFDIDHPGEPAAGIMAFTDTVTVSIDSGEPGGEPGEFTQELRQFLSEWYIDATVKQR